MRFIITVIFFVSHSSVVLFAQNLVPNPGFEVFKVCPGGYSERIAEFHVNEWRSANAGTPDHFHECSSGEADVPHNWAGISHAHEGVGYIGLYMWMATKDYREFAQSRLAAPLIKDTLYTIQFHYKLSSYSKFAIDRIGLLLSDSIVTYKGDHSVDGDPTFMVLQDSALTENTGSWEKANWKFRAKGGEQFITIGNFSSNGETRYYKIKFRDTPEVMLKDASYYYIDDVSVVPVYLERQKMLIPAFEPTDIDVNTTYVLRNIQFEFDSYKLLPSSFDELDALAKYVLKNPHVKLQLAGHTDDRGGEKYNTNLSRNRAKSVAQYLMLQGITTERVETFGYGKSKPLVADDTEEARTVNRRVEIRFLEF